MQLFQCNVVNISKAVFLRLVFVVLFLWLVTAPNLLWAKPPAKDFLMACYSGTIEEVKQGIEAGADVNAVSPQNYTPLMAAVLGQTDSFKKVEMLLAAKADPNIEWRRNGETAFDFAISDTSYNLNLIKLFLEADIKMHLVTTRHQPTPLFRACMHSRFWPDKEKALLLEEVLKSGVDVHQKNGSGKTALAFCADVAGPESLSLLLQAGSEIDAVSSSEYPSDGGTALTAAARSNSHPESIILLLDHGANPNHRNKENRTALERAQENSTPGAPHIQAILRNPENRAQWRISEPPSVADLILLCSVGTAEEVRRAIEAGVEVNAVSEQGHTPLIAAILSQVDSSEKVDLLLKAKADPNLKNKDGNTPLNSAIRNWYNNNIETVSRLLEAKADVNAVDRGTTPFLEAAGAGSPYGNPRGLFSGRGWPHDQHVRLLKLLLENGADASLRYENGVTALMAAASNSKPESLRVIIEAGQDVNAKAFTSFFSALLAATGIFPSSVTGSGDSALLFAAESNPYPESIRLLLDSGADQNYSRPQKDCNSLCYTEGNDNVAAEQIKEILREAVNK